MTPIEIAPSSRASSEDAILIVEDDPLMRAFLARGLDAWFRVVEVAADLAGAKTLLSSCGAKFCAVVSAEEVKLFYFYLRPTQRRVSIHCKHPCR